MSLSNSVDNAFLGKSRSRSPRQTLLVSSLVASCFGVPFAIVHEALQSRPGKLLVIGLRLARFRLGRLSRKGAYGQNRKDINPSH
jgi:hypothetical protein